MKRIIWSRFFRNWLSPRGTTVTRATKKPLLRATVLPRLEHLEDRTLLSAPTFTVNQAGDAGVGSGTFGDIRYCIEQADLTPNAGAMVKLNAATIGGNIIVLTHGELEVSNNMSISNTGTGSFTISGGFQLPSPTNPAGNPGSRIFNITSSQAVVTISGLTITDGSGSPTDASTPGNQGGDIFNGGTLTLQNDVVENGFVLGVVGGPPARGGGIFNAEGQTGSPGASLTLDGTIVENNLAQGANGLDSHIFGLSGGDGGFGAGGGVFNDSNASLNLLNGSQIINNTALGGNGGRGLNGLNGGNNVSGQTGGSGGGGGAGFGGGLFNNAGGNVSITGSSTLPIIIGDNLALGGHGGNGDFGGNAGNATIKFLTGPAGGNGGNGGGGGSTLGGGLYNTGSILHLAFAQFAGNQAKGGDGGTAAHGGKGGNGGSNAPGGTGGLGGQGGDGGGAEGGAIYSAGNNFQVLNSEFIADSAGVGNQALGGTGNTASNGGAGGNAGTSGKPAFHKGGSGGGGGGGGKGGAALGGAVFNGAGDVSFTNVTMTVTRARGGMGGVGATAGPGGSGGAGGPGGAAGIGGAGGAGGAALGAGVYNSGGALSFLNFTSTQSQAVGGSGNAGGTGGVGGHGGNGGGGNTSSGSASAHGGNAATGGKGGVGGAGGAAQGGGFYTVGGALTVTNSTFTNDSVTSGTGSTGGTGGNGGVGGKAGKKFFFGGAGGLGGDGGIGGNAGYAAGGGGVNAGGNVTITASAFNSDLVQAGNGGDGGLAGNGGEGGDAAASFLTSGTGANGGRGGNGGSGSSAQGGGLSVTNGTLTVTNTTFGGAGALQDQVLGGSGGNAGDGGLLNINGAPGHGFPIESPPFFPPHTPNGGEGGTGGAGTSVSGGGLAVSPSGAPSEINIVNNYPGLNFGQSGGFTPPDTQGGAGPDSFVETVNATVGIFIPKTTGATVVSDSLDHFFFTVGALPQVPFASLGDAVSTYDSLAGRFVVGDLYSNLTDTGNFFVFAVSKSNNPTTLRAADWNFYEINISEPGIFFQDYPGNLGYNADALIVDFNSFSDATGGPVHTLINAMSMSALTTGAPLTLGSNFFQTDVSALLPRPATMTDAQTGGPMWFVESDGAGGQAIPAGGSTTIHVIKMTDVLSSTPTFTTYDLAVNRYFQDTPPLQPDGSSIFRPIDSRILNADESNGLLVAAQFVSDAARDLDNIQWYEINLSNPNAPTLVQNGDVTGGPGVYDTVPAIAINPQGNIGMTFMQSGTSSGQFLSMYVTGRLASDPLGAMQTPVLVAAGTGDKNYNDPFGRLGDMAGINVDSDGSFWAVNEFATTDSSFNWGTAIAHFTVMASMPPPRAVSLSDVSSDNNVLVAGNGGNGGKGGRLPNLIYPPSLLTRPVGGLCGDGGSGGDAQGGGIYLAASAMQMATLSGVDASNNSSRGGVGGEGGSQGYPATSSGKGGSDSGKGGKGGSVLGGGLADLNYSLTVTASSTSASTFNNNSGTGGAGGMGGGVSSTVPNTSYGGNGGAGGSAQGGGIAFENELGTALALSITGASASNNQMIGAVGGAGGGAGTWDHDHILGGAGGAGGRAQGGGLYILAGNVAVNTSTINNMTLMGDILTGGNGGFGGAGASAKTGTSAGAFAAGGAGGEAQGGGLYNESLNTASASALTIGGSTLAANQLNGGNGGLGGTGTTSNGGPGGDGGDGGSAEGGGVFGGDNTRLTVFNTTIGGLSGDPNNLTANSNILVAGSGGGGNNAGTPGGVPKADGGNGGNGGSVLGAGVYFPSGTALFLNDTILNNLAVTNGLGGSPGSGAGSGGKAGNLGDAGAANGGGYFAGATSTNSIGNSILALNNSSSGADGFGGFTSLGNNFLTSTGGATGFNTGSGGSDQLVTAAQLNLGPLLNNGGLTLTDALLPGSTAIDAGKNSLITAAVFGASPTDQRGVGFPRIFNNTVDVGAFEYQQPIIASLSPSSDQEGSGPFTLTITGNAFEPGAIVVFGGTPLTPTSITSTQLIVTVPGPLPIDSDGPISVIVENPDGSGIAGNTVNSATASFTITEAPFALNNPGQQTNDITDTVSLPITPTAPDELADVSNFTDVVNGQHTLPTGLTIDANTGVISGTIDPSDSGTTYTVTITANDGAAANNVTASITFTWVVNPFSLRNPGDQTNNEGDPVSLQITASSGVPTINYSAVGLPTGLTINANTGVISGTIDPRAASGSPYTVTVTGGPAGASASTTFTWTVNDTTPPAVTGPSNQTNFTGDTVNVTIASVDADSFTATGLPNGLSINATNGTISGTIANGAQGNYTVTVTATDSGVTTNVSFSWTVAVPFSLLNPGDQGNDEGDQPTLQIFPSMGYTARNYSASGLPTGLSIDGITGLISGTIDLRAAGTYTVTVRATDTQNQTSSTTFTWTVGDTTPPVLTNPGLQLNTAGDVINHFAIQGADADPGSFTDMVNNQHTLPPGLTINANTGVISGTLAQTDAGNYTVTIQAADGSILSAPMSFLWSITPSTAGSGNGGGGGGGGGGGLPLPPPGSLGLVSNLSIASVVNQYPGLFQQETVVINVTNPNGYLVNEGVVTIQVDGQTVYAPVVNGMAVATIDTGLFDFGLWQDLLFSHGLTANYGDSSGVFAPSGAGVTEPAIWLDFFFNLLSTQLKQLTQLQV